MRGLKKGLKLCALIWVLLAGYGLDLKGIAEKQRTRAFGLKDARLFFFVEEIENQ